MSRKWPQTLVHVISVILVTVIVLASVTTQEGGNEFSFGACLPGKESCKECYLTLVQSLLGNSDNVFNLSNVFTSGDHDDPSFMIVNYEFQFDDQPSQREIWLWAETQTYFLYPLDIFQFISLYFGNPREFYETSVSLSLNGTECYGVNNEYMRLLTQRLKVYIHQQSIDPKIPDSYMSAAVNNATLPVLLDNVVKDIIITCPIMVLFSILTIIFIVLMIILCGTQEVWQRKQRKAGLSHQAKATTMSICWISLNKMIIFIGLDARALIQRDFLDERVKNILFSNHTGTVSDILYNVPVILLCFDLTALIVAVGVATIGIFYSCHCFCSVRSLKHDSYKERCKWKWEWCVTKDFHYYCFALTVVPFIASCLNHAPYIIMAYVSDADHASSIFVYYIVVLFLEFGLTQYALRKCLEKQYSYTLTSRSKCTCILCNFIVFPMMLGILVNGTMISIFLFFYYIPISYVLSNAPSQAVLIYQSVVVLVGGYITYKTVFKQDDVDHGSLLGSHVTPMVQQTKQKLDLVAFYEQELVHEPDKKSKRAMYLEKKIIHLRTEILLNSLQDSIICVPHGSPRQADLVDFHKQQNEAIDYLLTEIMMNMSEEHTLITTEEHTLITTEEDKWLYLYQSEEKKRLENEIVDLLKVKMDHLWLEPNKREEINKLTEQIHKLPEGRRKTDLNEMVLCLIRMSDKVAPPTNSSS